MFILGYGLQLGAVFVYVVYLFALEIVKIKLIDANFVILKWGILSIDLFDSFFLIIISIMKII